jgi:hypothetical protein
VDLAGSGEANEPALQVLRLGSCDRALAGAEPPG